MTDLSADFVADLWEQWEYNHSQQCDRVWPHAPGEQCRWPPMPTWPPRPKEDDDK